jgi:chorismate synthase
MAGNSFGELFRLTTFGESHGKAIGLIVDGCPSGLKLDIDFIARELQRRRPGQSAIVSQRKEPDEVEILSGLFEGRTTGAPISMIILNKDHKTQDYSHIESKYRPSHADYTYDKKFGHRDYRGGGRSSARETVARVAAGAIAKQLLKQQGIQIQAYVSSVGNISVDKPYTEFVLNEAELNPVRCPDSELAVKMESLIKETRKQGDTVGGTVTGVVFGVPVGWGEPVFDKLHADLGKAMLSINAVKGFEYGSGFEGTKLKGSEHNDIFEKKDGRIITKTNFSGGIQGGISNGMDIYFRVAFKPVATLMRDQDSIDSEGKRVVVKGKGRHDPCVVPRAVPIVEAMAALVLTDHYLRNKAVRL